MPWREAEEFGNLRRAFEGFAKQQPLRHADVVLFAGVASHYIQDAHQPFHASNNFDGQLTGNNGIHARFERDLVRALRVAAVGQSRAGRPPIVNPRDAAFEILLASYQLVDAILKADRDAVAGKDTYDAAYYESVLRRGPADARETARGLDHSDRRCARGAWEQAGKPALKIVDARPVQQVRPAKATSRAAGSAIMADGDG